MRPRAAVAEAVSAAPAVAAPVAKAPEPAPVVAPVPEPEPVPVPVPAPEVASAEVVSAPAPEPAPEPQPEPEAAPVEPEPEVVAEAAPPEVSAPPSDPVPEPVVEPVVEAAPDPVPVAEAASEPADPVAATAEPAASEAQPEAGPDSSSPTDDDDTPSAIPEAAGAVAAAAVATAAAPAAYAVDDSVLAILREEAERESQARKADATRPLEVQADLGIDAAPPVARRPVEVISVDPSASSPSDDGEDKNGGRRTRLPDVEEINSTLRPNEQALDETAADAAVAAEEGRSGFRSGFLLVMTIAILASALYMSADALAEAVPALGGFLKAYVGIVDSLRLQLDGLMQSATVAINGSST
ncbi:MAG: hypothetical protein ACKO2N_04880 [Tabrizicola sp.]